MYRIKCSMNKQDKVSVDCGVKYSEWSVRLEEHWWKWREDKRTCILFCINGQTCAQEDASGMPSICDVASSALCGVFYLLSVFMYSFIISLCSAVTTSAQQRAALIWVNSEKQSSVPLIMVHQMRSSPLQNGFLHVTWSVSQTKSSDTFYILGFAEGSMFPPRCGKKGEQSQGQSDMTRQEEKGDWSQRESKWGMVIPLSASPVAGLVSANDPVCWLTQTDGELTPISPLSPDLLWQLTTHTHTNALSCFCHIREH